MDFGLKNKRIVITGGSSGIGLEVARSFVQQGAYVTITSDRADVFDAQSELASANCHPVHASRFDISSRAEVADFFQGVGPLDILINNAGVFWDTPSLDRSEKMAALFVKQIMINLVGSYWCATEAVPHMSSGGRIIFTSSISGRIGSPNHTSYIASKHGILGLVKGMAMDLGPLGITVNAVCPGSTATEMNLRSLSEERQKLAASRMSLNPGLLRPADHVGTYLYLSSDAASQVTGQAITVDRGQTVCTGT